MRAHGSTSIIAANMSGASKTQRIAAILPLTVGKLIEKHHWPVVDPSRAIVERGLIVVAPDAKAEFGEPRE